jgi:hypothetical protein
MGARQFAVRTFGSLSWVKVIDKGDAKIYASDPYEISVSNSQIYSD